MWGEPSAPDFDLSQSDRRPSSERTLVAAGTLVSIFKSCVDMACKPTFADKGNYQQCHGTDFRSGQGPDTGCAWDQDSV